MSAKVSTHKAEQNNLKIIFKWTYAFEFLKNKILFYQHLYSGDDDIINPNAPTAG